MDSEYTKTDPTESARAAQELLGRPTLEETEAGLKQAIEQLAAYASSLVPGMTWKPDTPSAPYACDAPFDQTNGRQVHIPAYTTQGGDTAHGGGIPDDVWPQVRDKAREIAAGLGATENDPFPFNEKVDDRQARFYGPNGTVLWVATRGISGDTGCRLPAADKPTASPVAPTAELPK
ncbi:LppA family lipoprotein [Nocardia sp. CDC153]|uniref:LppA family lipoprotein n=1 Tax=Nocardia sp. CDC153 TaxID=3112167 RepID=UPI002DB9C50C|nr:LppA family lipoprotein [Nocardia sp. CDC153]MEC3957121.1 LppA family lipoprotein [Nocardia sp. CDC153]